MAAADLIWRAWRDDGRIRLAETAPLYPFATAPYSSAGVAMLGPGGLDDPDAVVQAADRALCQAKIGGRDRVVVHREAGRPG